MIIFLDVLISNVTKFRALLHLLHMFYSLLEDFVFCPYLFKHLVKANWYLFGLLSYFEKQKVACTNLHTLVTGRK